MFPVDINRICEDVICKDVKTQAKHKKPIAQSSHHRMDYEMDLAMARDRPILTLAVSLLDISCNEQGVYHIEKEEKDKFLIVGQLERGMSPMAHILVRDSANIVKV